MFEDIRYLNFRHYRRDNRFSSKYGEKYPLVDEDHLQELDVGANVIGHHPRDHQGERHPAERLRHKRLLDSEVFAHVVGGCIVTHIATPSGALLFRTSLKLIPLQIP